jgi:hypothetical protein
MDSTPAKVSLPSIELDPGAPARAAAVGSILLEDEEERKRRLKGLPKMKKGGTASARADGCAIRGKTRGKIV